MCLNPLTVGSDQWGEPIVRNCRKCWQCIDHKVNGWVGRCVAETRTARHVRFVTLTYGRDEAGNASHPAMAVLTYSHVQLWFKKLRLAGYEFSYFVAGEYGTEKGRAHWHAILFFRNDPPKVTMDKRIHHYEGEWEMWPHGWCQWETIKGDAFAAVRYAAKYVQKADDVFAQTHIAMSKKPPLGSEYFKQEALRLVTEGLPLCFEYDFPDVLRMKGHRVRFRLTGKVREIMTETYLAAWKSLRKEAFPPASETLEDMQDRMAKRYAGKAMWEHDKPSLPDLPPSVVIDWNKSNGWDKVLRKYHITDQHGKTWWWIWVPDEAHIFGGTGRWRNLRKVGPRLGETHHRLVPYRE